MSLKLDMTIRGFCCLFVEWRALLPSAKNRHFSVVTMTIPEPFRGNNMAMRRVDLRQETNPEGSKTSALVPSPRYVWLKVRLGLANSLCKFLERERKKIFEILF